MGLCRRHAAYALSLTLVVYRKLLGGAFEPKATSNARCAVCYSYAIIVRAPKDPKDPNDCEEQEGSYRASFNSSAMAVIDFFPLLLSTSWCQGWELGKTGLMQGTWNVLDGISHGSGKADPDRCWHVLAWKEWIGLDTIRSPPTPSLARANSFVDDVKEYCPLVPLPPPPTCPVVDQSSTFSELMSDATILLQSGASPLPPIDSRIPALPWIRHQGTESHKFHLEIECSAAELTVRFELFNFRLPITYRISNQKLDRNELYENSRYTERPAKLSSHLILRLSGYRENTLLSLQFYLHLSFHKAIVKFGLHQAQAQAQAPGLKGSETGALIKPWRLHYVQKARQEAKSPAHFPQTPGERHDPRIFLPPHIKSPYPAFSLNLAPSG
ncbi:uncharacterized protein CLUP02_10529 [Colletotrichum lupini]|uniref:Uncharacterized protein n=1 Tax=Colletotrichum lupini TaxID=145971 RepID=A0A9Q8SWY6_9PEZI|nr:uncharacterized protein CLUP02_10529 [Colletotrichum lupini]UQC85033.1 hypothetical protein CLUP02_10529 [Colletotrichum lupini]